MPERVVQCEDVCGEVSSKTSSECEFKHAVASVLVALLLFLDLCTVSRFLGRLETFTSAPLKRP